MRAISQFYNISQSQSHSSASSTASSFFYYPLKSRFCVAMLLYNNGLFITPSFPALKNHYCFFLMAPPHSLHSERWRPCSQAPLRRGLLCKIPWSAASVSALFRFLVPREAATLWSIVWDEDVAARMWRQDADISISVPFLRSLRPE